METSQCVCNASKHCYDKGRCCSLFVVDSICKHDSIEVCSTSACNSSNCLPVTAFARASPPTRAGVSSGDTSASSTRSALLCRAMPVLHRPENFQQGCATGAHVISCRAVLLSCVLNGMLYAQH
jgi:hypothetical protein